MSRVTQDIARAHNHEATCPELTLSQGGKTHKVKKQDVRRHDYQIS
jgi:hypothetical protein